MKKSLMKFLVFKRENPPGMLSGGRYQKNANTSMARSTPIIMPEIQKIMPQIKSPLILDMIFLNMVSHPTLFYFAVN